MSHPSYAKGYRFERRTQAWLVHLGHCTRSMMSRGADLTLLRHLRNWTISCKCRKDDPCKFISGQLENHDAVVWGWDRSIPIIAMHLPKFVELVGQAEAQDHQELGAA